MRFFDWKTSDGRSGTSSYQYGGTSKAVFRALIARRLGVGQLSVHVQELTCAR